jgi:hypothetical protein
MAPRGKMKANVQRLLEERDRLLQQIEALKQTVGGLELAISLLEKEDNDQPHKGTSGRGKAKEVLLDLLKEVGTTGLNASSAVEIAARRGVKLARGTAASTLSRLKADGVVIHEHDRYRLVEFSRPKPVVNVTGGLGGGGGSPSTSTATPIAAMAAGGILRAS